MIEIWDMFGLHICWISIETSDGCIQTTESIHWTNWIKLEQIKVQGTEHLKESCRHLGCRKTIALVIFFLQLWPVHSTLWPNQREEEHLEPEPFIQHSARTCKKHFEKAHDKPLKKEQKDQLASDMIKVLPRRLASQATSRCSSGLKDNCISGASAILILMGWPHREWKTVRNRCAIFYPSIEQVLFLFSNYFIFIIAMSNHQSKFSWVHLQGSNELLQPAVNKRPAGNRLFEAPWRPRLGRLKGFKPPTTIW